MDWGVPGRRYNTYQVVELPSFRATLFFIVNCYYEL